MIRPLTESRIERNGIKAGTIAPDFTLPDITGRTISLGKYYGHRVLLVFSDPRCGPCTQLAPHLVHCHRRWKNRLAIVMVARGELAENQRKAEQFGFEFPVVMQERWKLSRQYGIFKTPAAFLISEEGRTLRPVAVGFDEIASLTNELCPAGPSQKIREVVETILRVFREPIARRHAFQAAGWMLASVGLSLIGMTKTARALACQAGEIPCGIDCCEQGWQCCGGECCPSQSTCCNGICCAPTEVCADGKCQQRVLP